MEKKNLLHIAYDYFVSNFDQLYKKYYGKYIVIKEQSVDGPYGSIEDAIKSAMKKYELGTFIVKHVTKSELEPQIFHSRVRFDNGKSIYS